MRFGYTIFTAFAVLGCGNPTPLPVNSVQTDSRAVKMIQRFEGFRAQAYRDCGRGVLTIGWGRTENVGATTTKESELPWLRARVVGIKSHILSRSKVDLTDGQLDALTDLCYNCGENAIFKSHGWAALQAGDLRGAERMLFDARDGFVTAGGRVCAGLVKRRAAEAAIFKGE